MSKQNRINRVLAAVLAVGALAVAVPVTSSVHAGGGSVVAMWTEPGGGGH
jgi:Flp pilus assembly protein CpaB